MPIPTSPEFKEVVSGPHTAKHRVDVEVDGVVIDSVYPYKGEVSVDNSRTIRRTIRLTIADEEGKYTPQSAADTFSPVAGTVLKAYSGVEIPGTVRTSIVMHTQAQWETATLTNVAVSADGAISII